MGQKAAERRAAASYAAVVNLLPDRASEQWNEAALTSLAGGGKMEERIVLGSRLLTFGRALMAGDVEAARSAAAKDIGDDVTPRAAGADAGAGPAAPKHHASPEAAP